jgi:peptide deformylase
MEEQQQEQQSVEVEPPAPPVYPRRLEPPKHDTLQGCRAGVVHGIVFHPNPKLREASLPVLSFGDLLDGLVADMAATMYAVGGVGLSAVQIGVPLRVFIVDIYANQPMTEKDNGQSQLLVAVNPVLAFTAGNREREREGCLSFPGINEHITRSMLVGLRGYDRRGVPFALRAGGALGRIIQHEMDHLDGMTFMERMSPLARRLTSKRMKKFHQGVQRDSLRVTSRPTSP